MVESFIKELSLYTGLSENLIKSYVYDSFNTRDYYKKVRIPKKNGGVRVVYVPIPEIKLIQHFLSYRFLSKLPVSKNATAYIKGNSIIDNAKPHYNGSSFLFLDVHDFFNSIDFEKMLGIVRKYLGDELSDSDCIILLKLCSHNKTFAQGCVSSPVISNAYLYEFDLALSKLVETLPNGVYTRYSDDITISSSTKIPQTLVKDIQALLKRESLEINFKKTHFSSYIDRLSVTGVRIKRTKEISLNTKFKKTLKTRIYHILKSKKPNFLDIEQTVGLLNYLKMIDLHYYNIINLKYREESLLTIDRLKQLKREISINRNSDVD